MKVFVTGATGFIGTWFVREATRAGHEVRALCRTAEAGKALPAGAEAVVGSLATVEPVALAGCHCLVHLAAAGVDGQGGWEKCFGTNVHESLRLWVQASAAGIGRYVICGSCFEYGRASERYANLPVDAPLEPTTPYGASKAAASMAAVAFAETERREVLVLRPFHVFGEGEASWRFWSSLRAAALAGRDFPMTSGQQVRDFVPVSEVALRIASSLGSPVEPGRARIENVGTGRPRTLQSFAEEWWARWKAPGRLLLGALPYRPNEVMRYVPQV